MGFLDKLVALHKEVPQIYLDRIKEQEQTISRQADKIASLRELVLALENTVLSLRKELEERVHDRNSTSKGSVVSEG